MLNNRLSLGRLPGSNDKTAKNVIDDTRRQTCSLFLLVCLNLVGSTLQVTVVQANNDVSSKRSH